MSNQNMDEKELRKRQEKSAEEKQWDEKYRRDPLGTLIWPLILIWAGVVFLAGNLGLLDRLPGSPGTFGSNAWSLVLLGAGLILLLEAAVRLIVPEFRRPVTGTVIGAIILIGLGLGNLTNWAIVWPLIIILLGVSILFRSMTRRG